MCTPADELYTKGSDFGSLCLDGTDRIGRIERELRNARFGGANEGTRTISPTHIDRDLARALGNNE